MALSEEEQRLLDQMEAALAAEDPKLAHTLRGTPRVAGRGMIVGAGFGFVVGLACLVGGMQVHPVVSILGFVIMVASAALLMRAWQRSSPSGEPGPSAHPDGQRPRMEDRRPRGTDEF